MMTVKCRREMGYLRRRHLIRGGHLSTRRHSTSTHQTSHERTPTKKNTSNYSLTMELINDKINNNKRSASAAAAAAPATLQCWANDN